MGRDETRQRKMTKREGDIYTPSRTGDYSVKEEGSDIGTTLERELSSKKERAIWRRSRMRLSTERRRATNPHPFPSLPLFPSHLPDLISGQYRRGGGSGGVTTCASASPFESAMPPPPSLSAVTGGPK